MFFHQTIRGDKIGNKITWAIIFGNSSESKSGNLQASSLLGHYSGFCTLLYPWYPTWEVLLSLGMNALQLFSHLPPPCRAMKGICTTHCLSYKTPSLNTGRSAGNFWKIGYRTHSLLGALGYWQNPIRTRIVTTVQHYKGLSMKKVSTQKPEVGINRFLYKELIKHAQDIKRCADCGWFL